MYYNVFVISKLGLIDSWHKIQIPLKVVIQSEKENFKK